MKSITDFDTARPAITRLVVGFALITLCVRWACSATVHTLDNPVWRVIGYNFTAWAMRAMGLEDVLLAGGLLSQLFWGGMLICGLAALLLPRSRLLVFFFWALFFIEVVLFNVGAAMSDQSRVPLTVMLIPLWAARPGGFKDWWAAARYFVCWIFSLAFLQKAVHGSLWAPTEGARSVEANFALILYERPDWAWSRVIRWCLQHPALLNLGHKVFVLLEGAFIAGFFTRRLDGLLLWAALAVIASTIFFGDANYWEMSIVAVLFIPARWWSLFVGKVWRQDTKRQSLSAAFQP
jgi:hypothetical protein